jgi:hypothetical protein
MNLVALTVSIAAFFTSTIFAGRQLRVSQMSNNTMIAVELLARERRADEFMESEDYVLNVLASQHQPDKGVSLLPLDARRHVNRIGMYYNSLGQLVAHGAVDQWLMISTASYRTRQAWAVLGPYIRAERLAGSTRYMSHFEHLAYLAFSVSPQQIEQKIRLRRFRPAEDEKIRQEMLGQPGPKTSPDTDRKGQQQPPGPLSQ